MPFKYNQEQDYLGYTINNDCITKLKEGSFIIQNNYHYIKEYNFLSYNDGFTPYCLINCVAIFNNIKLKNNAK